MTALVLTDKFAELQDKHRSLLASGQTEYVGDVMMEYAALHDERGADLARDMYYLEAAASYFENDRLNDADRVLKLINV